MPENTLKQHICVPFNLAFLFERVRLRVEKGFLICRKANKKRN